jgi:dihydrodipicolinate synthase/N-acetylneuraminate lyase
MVALTTPFDEQGRVDAAALRAHVEWLVAEGVDGLMPCGTTGEGALLADDEVLAVVGLAVEAAAGAVPVVAHVGRPGTDATRALADAALQRGADAVSAVVPYYFPLEDEQIVAHFETLIAAVAPAPFLVYVIPGHTGNDLGAAELGGLLRAGAAGLKDSTKSLERHTEYVAAARESRPDAAVFVGSDPLLGAARRAGGTGSVTAMANAVPGAIAALHRAADAGDWDEVEARQAEVLAARSALGPGGTARATKRAVAAHVAAYPERVRAPL